MRFAPTLSQLLDYLQAACLGLFLLIVLERTVSIRLKSKVNPIRLRIGRDGVQHSIVFLLFLGVNLWAAMVLIYALHIGHGFLPPLLGRPQIPAIGIKLFGLALVLLGFAIFLLSLASLGSSWRLGIDENNPGELVTSGVYSLSRNPIYVFFDLYFAGTFLLNGALIFALLAIFIGLTLHLQILQEERFLLRVFGQEYRVYRARTGRYITWPALVHSRRLLPKTAPQPPTVSADPSEHG